MNESVNSIITWLEHLQVCMPPEHIALVGAGNGKGAWVAWLQTQFMPSTLVEADTQQFAALQRLQSSGALAGATLINKVVAAQQGAAEFFTANVTAESGLLPAESLRHLWPNLHTVLAKPVQATTLAQLLQVEQEAHQWLMLDCLPAAALLQTAQVVLPKLDVVLARVLLTESNKQLEPPKGTSLAELAQALPDFMQLALQPCRHPDIAYALFVRDYRRAWQNTKQTQIAEAKAKQVALEVQEQLQSHLQQAQVAYAELLKKQELQAQSQQSLEADLAQTSQGLDAERKAKQAALQAQAQLQSQLQQAHVENAELLKKQELQAQSQQAVEADLAKTSQGLGTERKAKQAALQAQAQLQSQLQQAHIENAELLKKQELQAQSQQAVEADLAKTSQGLDTERKAKQAALQAQAQLQTQLQQALAVNAELLKKQDLQAKSQQSLEADLAKTSQGLDTERKAKQAVLQAQAQLQNQLDKAQVENAELLKKQELQAQTQQALEADLTQTQQARDVEAQAKAELKQQLDQAPQVQIQLLADIAQKAEVQALFKQQADELIRVRKFLDASLKKEITNATRQVQAFAGLENYWRTGELPTANTESQGYPVSPDFSLYVVSLLEQNNYDLVIEFGSGVSTVVIAKALRKLESKRGGKPAVGFASFDHLPQYHQQTLDMLQQANLAEKVQLLYAPLKDWQSPSGNIYPFYNCQEALATFSKKYSSTELRMLVIVDGPPQATGPHARYPACPMVLTHFAGARIDWLVDDYIRSDEKEIVQLWLDELAKANIPHKKTERKLERNACLFQVFGHVKPL